MRLIRKNIFETNSSSCHSLTIDSNSKLNDIPTPDSEGKIHLYSEEFGWEIETYSDFYSKAAYIIVYIRDWSKEEKEEFRNLFESIIKDYTQCEEVVYEDLFWDQEIKSYTDRNGNDKTYISNIGEGFIDHQSVEDKDLHYLFENEGKLLKDFLFNSNSILYTDNDNH